ncbi:hypothetical protein JXD20_02810 [Candidatus Peregrinibacteria bacterium]|nr:hypothetical protein [Candidatus Peregrinibacteria bacterium]
MAETNTEQFNGKVFIDELIEEMDMQNEDPDELARLKEAMLEALTRMVFQAAEEAIEPEVVDAVIEKLADEEDPGTIVRALLRASPGAQLAMVQALGEFRDNTLEAFNQLKE